MRSFLLALTVGVCVCLLSSCGGGSGPASHSVTLAQMGGSQGLRVGEALVLKLPENPSTGYSWKRSWAPEALLNLVQDYYASDGPVMPGSGGTRSYVFEALAPGQVVVTVQYGRWWEGGETEDPHTITLDITP